MFSMDLVSFLSPSPSFFSFHLHPSVLMLPPCLSPSHWWIWSRARDGKSGVSKWNIDPVLRGLAFTLSCVLSYRLFRSACNRNYYRRPGRVITWHGGEGAEEGPLYISFKGVIYRTCYLQPGAAPPSIAFWPPLLPAAMSFLTLIQFG